MHMGGIWVGMYIEGREELQGGLLTIVNYLMGMDLLELYLEKRSVKCKAVLTFIFLPSALHGSSCSIASSGP